MNKTPQQENQEDEENYIYIGVPNYTYDFEELYLEQTKNCFDDNTTREQFFICSFRNIDHHIFDFRTEIANAHFAAQKEFGQTSRTKVFDTCYSPAYAQEQIDRAMQYKEFLREKQKAIVKSTRTISANEKYQILSELDFFNSKSWVLIGSSDRETLLAEVLQCNIDTARHLINGTGSYRMKPSKAAKVKERIDNMKKGV